MIKSFKTLILAGALLFIAHSPDSAAAATTTSQPTLSEQLQMLVIDVQNIALNDFLKNVKADKNTLSALEDRTYTLIEVLKEDTTELTEEEKQISADKVAQCLQVLKMYEEK